MNILTRTCHIEDRSVGGVKRRLGYLKKAARVPKKSARVPKNRQGYLKKIGKGI